MWNGMMACVKRAVAAGMLALCAVPASAATIFFDNFDSETLSTNYTGFANWTVSNGSVDLIGSGAPAFFDFLPGNGRYVDMDGSTSDAGRITTNTTFTFQPGLLYTLSFDLAGSQTAASAGRPLIDTVQVSLGSALGLLTIPQYYTVPFLTYSYDFAVAATTQAKLSFEGLGGDNVGLLLDNVRLTVVPVPGALVLLGTALAGLGLMRRRAR